MREDTDVAEGCAESDMETGGLVGRRRMELEPSGGVSGDTAECGRRRFGGVCGGDGGGRGRADRPGGGGSVLRMVSGVQRGEGGGCGTTRPSEMRLRTETEGIDEGRGRVENEDREECEENQEKIRCG